MKYCSWAVVTLAIYSIRVTAFDWPWDDDSSSPASTTTTTGGGFQWPWQDSSTTSSGSSSATSSASSSGSSTGSRNAYQPYATTCPSHSLVREAVNISLDELEYILLRQEETNANLIEFLSKKANLTDFDAESFITNYSKSHNISIGLAFSGGGYRAMLCGAGQLLALDDRFNDSVSHGLGGLLQSSTYLTGLSGGNWLVGLVVLNDWISVADIVDGKKDIWNLEDSIFNPNGINLVKTIRYYNRISSSILAKDENFDTSVTDIWGRALSYQFFDDDTGGENITWSGIRDLDSFKNHQMPFPIVVANGRTPGTIIINENSTVFEITPYELGSWDPSLRTMSDVKYIGTNNTNGTPNGTDDCIVNFDNAGFIMGTSSSLFNQVVIRLGYSDLNSALKTIFNGILKIVRFDQVDVASYKPNPFFDASNAGIKTIVNNDTLFLVDGGEDQQNVPFYPLIQPARNVDIIFGFDNSADTDQGWPNGTSIAHTYRRQFASQGKGTPFPYAPSEQEFLDQNLGEKPYFFGCDATNLTELVKYHGNDNVNETDIPIIVYVPNARQSYNSNTSTFKMSYDKDESNRIIQNGFETVTRGNFSNDSTWATCVGCAIIRRSQERLGQAQSDECKKCFQDYCWRGGKQQAAQVTTMTSSTTSKSSTTASSSPSSSDKPKKGGAPQTKAPLPYIFSSILAILGALLI